MSDAFDKYLALHRQYHPLFAKACVQPLSPAEEAELNAVLDLLKSLEPLLDSRVEALDAREEAAREAREIYEAHYRRKAELDRKFYGRSAPVLQNSFRRILAVVAGQ